MAKQMNVCFALVLDLSLNNQCYTMAHKELRRRRGILAILQIIQSAVFTGPVERNHNTAPPFIAKVVLEHLMSLSNVLGSIVIPVNEDQDVALRTQYAVGQTIRKISQLLEPCIRINGMFG